MGGTSWHPAVLLGTAAAVTGSVLGVCGAAGGSSASNPRGTTGSSASNPRGTTGSSGGGSSSSGGGGSSSSRSTSPKRVLVTGCNGSIGRPVCAWLKRAGHTVVGFDAAAHPAAAEGCSEFIEGDICDAEVVAAAMEGVDVLIHLAAFPDITDSDGNRVGFVQSLLMPNVAGLYVCVEAALQAGVARVVLASSVQVITGLTSSADVDARPKPNLPAVGGTDLFFAESDGVAPLHEYALTKVWAEQLGEMYSRVFGLSVVLARIGWFVRNEAEAEAMWQAESGALDGLEAGSGFSVYLSHDDAGRFYQGCVETAPNGAAAAAGECITTFVTSRQPTPRLDIEPAARLLGFEPVDTFPEGLPFPTAPPS